MSIIQQITGIYGEEGTGSFIWSTRERQRYWSSVASSSNGQVLAACVGSTVGSGYYGQIHTSTDSGATWLNRYIDGFFAKIKMSSTGQVMAAFTTNTTQSAFYISTNFGVSWSVAAVSATSNPSDIAISSNGSTLYFSVGVNVFTSIDFGSTWIQRSFDQNISGLDCTDSGQTCYACGQNGSVFKTVNYGSNWTYISSPGFIPGFTNRLSNIASSSDGVKVITIDRSADANQTGKIYTSLDGGLNWTAVTSSTVWAGLVCSSDGNTILALNSGVPTNVSGRIWISRNFGATWEQMEESRRWTGISCSDDASTVIASVGAYSSDPGFIYLGRYIY